MPRRELSHFCPFRDSPLSTNVPGAHIASNERLGCAARNALCESFFATVECELIDRRRFRSQAEARMAVFTFIEGWYNPRRRHSALDYLSPLDDERRTKAETRITSP